MPNYIYHSILLVKRLLLVFVLFTICRILFYIFNYQYFSALTWFETLKLFFFGLRFDLVPIVTIHVVFIALHILPGRFKNFTFYQYLLKVLFFTANIALIICNLADIEYFQYTNKRSNFFHVKSLGFGDVGNDFLIMLPQYLKDFWYLVVILLILSYIMWYFYPKLDKSKNLLSRVSFFSILVQLAFIFTVSVLWIYAFRGGFDVKPLRVINAAKYTDSRYVALVLNTPFTIMKSIGKNQLEERHYFAENEAIRYFNPHQKSEFQNDSNYRVKNVVIIILESFSCEYVGCLNRDKSGKAIGYTPFLDSLASKSMIFSRAFANASQSIEALPAIFSGIPALMENPYISSEYSANTINSIASVLKPMGYHSAFFHGATNGTMGFDNFCYVAGFQEYYGRKEYKNEKDFDGNWGIYDEEFLQYTAQTINKFRQPFVASVMTLSSHHPYSIPKRYANRFPKGTLLIHESIAYTDFALRKFFETASRMSWYSNTMFVLTADHTSLSTQKKYSTKVGRFRIPIVYFCPSDTTLCGVNETVTQQTDILPTVLAYVKNKQEFFAYGNNALSTNNQHFATMLTSGVYQIIENENVLSFDGEKCISMFNYQNDSLLTKNILPQTGTVKPAMESKIKSIIQHYNNCMINNKMK